MKSSASTALVLRCAPSSPGIKAIIDVLDRCGLPYKVEEVLQTPEASSSILAGNDILADLSQKPLLDFLWAHGAKFEDS